MAPKNPADKGVLGHNPGGQEMKTKACNLCHSATRRRFIDFADGEAEPLRIRLKGLPLLVCEQGHRQFMRPQFAAELLRHLTEVDEPGLPAGQETGLFRRHYLCQNCDSELEIKPDHRQIFSIDIELENIDSFTVDLSMPVYRCSACAEEQLHSLREIRKLTAKALADAFLEVDIPPPPA